MAKTKTAKRVAKKNDKKGLLVAIAAIALVAVFGTAYAFFTYQETSEKSNVIEVGTLTLDLQDASEGVLIEKAVPVTQGYALAHYTPYKFNVENSGNVDATYSLYLTDEEIGEVTRLADAHVRYQLTYAVTDAEGNKGTDETKSGLLSEIVGTTTENSLASRPIVAEFDIDAGATVEYTLYLWVDQDATNEIAGQKFSAKISIDAIQADGTE